MKVEILALGHPEPEFISYMIQKAIDANYSHLAIRCDGMIFHATGKGFRAEKEDAFKKDRYYSEVIIRDSASFELTKAEQDAGKLWLLLRLGTRYSQGQYLGFMVPALKSLVRNGDEKTICSEIVAEFLAVVLKSADPELKDRDFLDPKKVMAIAHRVEASRS